MIDCDWLLMVTNSIRLVDWLVDWLGWSIGLTDYSIDSIDLLIDYIDWSINGLADSLNWLIESADLLIDRIDWSSRLAI